MAEAQLAVAEKAHELAEARYEEDLKQASAEVDRARSALSNAQVQLSYATITAPIDGVIASVSTQEGETVAAGMQAPTFVTIIDLERLQVDAYVDEVDIGKVQPGQEAFFTVDTFPDREFKGRVNAIYPKAVIQENVVNYDVVVEILDEHGGSAASRDDRERHDPPRGENRRAGDSRKGHQTRARQERRLRLRTTASPNRAVVTIGWKDGQSVEVLAGLEEGQTVFLELPAEVQPELVATRES